MNMVIPNAGKQKWLAWALADDGTTLEEFTVELYQNDYTPVDGSLLANFTPADFTGYAAVFLARSGFSAPVIVANVAESTHVTVPEYECTGGSPQTVYGWVMYGSTSNVAVAAQRFDSPRVMASGSVERLDPFKLKLKSFT